MARSSAAGVLPRAVVWTGLVLAAAGMLSVLTPLVAGFGCLLPVVRFGGLVWLLFAAFTIAPETLPARPLIGRF